MGTNDSDTFAGTTTGQPDPLISGGQCVAKRLEQVRINDIFKWAGSAVK